MFSSEDRFVFKLAKFQLIGKHLHTAPNTKLYALVYMDVLLGRSKWTKILFRNHSIVKVVQVYYENNYLAREEFVIFLRLFRCVGSTPKRDFRFSDNDAEEMSSTSS